MRSFIVVISPFLPSTLIYLFCDYFALLVVVVTDEVLFSHEL